MLKIALQLANSILMKVTGRTRVAPPLGSNTMGVDDLEIINNWLKRKDEWYNEKETETLNREFAQWNGSAHAFSFMAGRDALSAAIDALGLKKEDEVIIPGYTCVQVPNAFHFAGVKVVYADIELDTYGINARGLEKKITPRTKAIVIHHLYGLVCRDYEALLNLARKRKLKVIEDCAQAAGAEFKGEKVGNQGNVAIYSCEHTMPFTAGQGGLVTTNNSSIAKKLEQIYTQTQFPDEKRVQALLDTLLYNYYAYAHPKRWFLKDWKGYTFRNRLVEPLTQDEIYGIRPDFYGTRMPAPIAAVALNQLKKLDRFNEQRRANAVLWDMWCKEAGYKKPTVIEDSKPIFLRYPVLVEPQKKDDLNWAWEQLKVEPGTWFQANIHPSGSAVNSPISDKAVAGCINLPTLDV